MYNVARVEVIDEKGCVLIQLKSEAFFGKKT